MSQEKTGKKTRSMRSPRSGAECPTGAHARNTGGKKGRSGRKSKAFLQRCLEATEDPLLWAASARKHPLGLLELSAGYAHGKPAQSVAVAGEIVIRTVRTWKPKPVGSQ